jgi:two-component system chemotaxis sensor kinase CheA
MGAAILGTGNVIVVLDVADLIANSALTHPAFSRPRAAGPSLRAARTILVAEDSLSTRELMKNILETHGYRVVTATDGLDALDRLTQMRPDLIVSDVQMPRMDGFEFCSTIKNNDQYKSIPVVMVTALEKEEDKRRGIEAGAQAYIVKTSFNQTNLLDTIARLVG